MTQPFAFPPPPPPPPKREPPNNVHVPSNNVAYGGARGRGSFREGHSSSRGSGFRGRGYGQNTSRGSQQSRGRQHPQHSYARGPFAPAAQGQISSKISDVHSSDAQLAPSQKRNHSTAFDTNKRPDNLRSRPLAPPAVPSFGLDLERILARKPESDPISQPPAQRKGNLLGLTPENGDNESESDDEGEEAKLGNVDLNLGLQFEYRGQTSSLRTPDQVAAWLAERRKKWPTQERVAVAKKEAEERRLRYEAEKHARIEAAREAAQQRQQQRVKERAERETAVLKERLLAQQVEKANKVKEGMNQEKIDRANDAHAVSKADRLRQKAVRAAEKLRAVEEALRKEEAASASGDGEAGDDPDLETLLAKVEKAAHGDDVDSLVNDSDTDTTSERDEHEGTSSSGSSSESDSESDSAPEVASSKQSGPERVAPPARTAPSSQSRTLCRNFTKTGRCKHGKRCRFLHERPPKSKNSNQAAKRKSLYQLMVEKEQEENQKKVLAAIIAMGEKGLLEQTADVKDK